MPASYFAHLLKKSIIGFGTDNKTLNRVLVTRSEVDMDLIRNHYKVETKNDLTKDIDGDITGDYGKLCILLGSL